MLNKKIQWITGLGLVTAVAVGTAQSPLFSDSFEATSANEVMTGHFIDAAVEGLNYSSASISGVTGANGAFKYIPGEEVIFSIGNIDIGKKTGQQYVNLFDLNDTYIDINNSSLRIAQLLQSLDEDDNPDNGIKLDLRYASENFGDNFSFDNNLSRAIYERQATELLRSINPYKSSLADMATVAQHVFNNLRTTDEYCAYPEGNWKSLTGYNNNVNITPTCEMRLNYEIYKTYVRPGFLAQASILTDRMEGLTAAELRFEKAKRHVLSNVTAVRGYVDTVTTSIDTIIGGSGVFTPTHKQAIIQNAISTGALINATIGPFVDKMFTDNQNENEKLVTSYSNLLAHGLSTVVSLQQCKTANQQCFEAINKAIRTGAKGLGIDEKNANLFIAYILDSTQLIGDFVTLYNSLDIPKLTNPKSAKAMLKFKASLIQVGANSFKSMFTRDYSVGSNFISKEIRDELEKTANAIAASAKCSTLVVADTTALTACVEAVGHIFDLSLDVFKAAIQTPKWRNVELNGNSNIVIHDVIERYIGFEGHRDKLAQAYGLEIDFTTTDLVRAVAKKDRNLKIVDDCDFPISAYSTGVLPFCVEVDEFDVVAKVNEKINYINEILEIRKIGWDNILIFNAPLSARKNEMVTVNVDLSQSNLTTDEMMNWGAVSCVADGTQYTESSPYVIHNALPTVYPIQLSFSDMGLKQISCKLQNNAAAGNGTVAFNKHFIGITAANSDAALYGVILDNAQVGENMTLTARGQNLVNLAVSPISGCNFSKQVKSDSEVVFSCVPTVSHMEPPVTVNVTAGGEILASPSFRIYPSNRITVSLDKPSYTVKPSDYDSQFFTITVSGVDYPVVVEYYLIDTQSFEILSIKTVDVDGQKTIRFDFDNNVLLGNQNRQFEVGVVSVRAANKTFNQVSAPVEFVALQNDNVSGALVYCGNGNPCEYQLNLPTLTVSGRQYLKAQSISPSGDLTLSDTGKVTYMPNRGFSGIAKAEAIYREADSSFLGILLPIIGGQSVKKIIWFNVAENHTPEPKLTINAPATATSGQEVTLTATVTGFENNCFNYLFVDWGDGTNSRVDSETSCQTSITTQHIYTTAQDTEYDIKVSVANNKGVSDYEVHQLAVTSTNTGPLMPTKLNDTGITLCGTAGSYSHSENCANAVANASDAQIPLGQDGHYGTGINGSKGKSFTTVSGGQCVQDNHTGLMWEVKTDDGGLHDKDNTYTWYSTTNNNYGNPGTQNGGSCSGSNCDTAAFVEAVNNAGWCGHNDWRLPSRRELYSIVDYSRVNPATETNYFPNTQSDFYWSSSSYGGYNSYAWGVNFYDGAGYDRAKNTSHYVRLVRGGQ